MKWVWYIIVPTLIMVLFLIMASFVVIDTQKIDVEATRADLLSCSLANLRYRSDQDVKFFELVRQLIVTPDIKGQEALVQQLKAFQFSPPTKAQLTAKC